MARFGQAYIEYRKDEDYDSYGPRIGGTVGVENKWLMYFAHGRDGNINENTFIGTGYTFFKKLYFDIKYDTNDNSDSVCYKIDYNQKLTESVSFSGEAYYTNYNCNSWSDYDEMVYNAGLKWQLKHGFAVLVHGYWTTTNVDNSTTNYDSHTFDRVLGLEYQDYKAIYISGRYHWKDFDYQNSSLNDSYSHKVTINASYHFNKHYNVYLTYNFPDTEDNEEIFGILYNF